MPAPIRTRKRTWDLPGAWYYITCVVRDRQSIFEHPENLALLRETLHRVQGLYPFAMLGYAFMPDHFHLLVALGEQTHITKLMHSLQRNYTRNYKQLHGLTEPMRLWQRGYWEHVIKSQQEFTAYLRYIHNNPIKHGLVADVADYPHTSYAEYVKRWGQWHEGRGADVSTTPGDVPPKPGE